MNRTLKLLGAAAVFALLLVAPPPALAESDCDADVSVSSQRDDPDRSIRRLAFRVEISTTADCAHIQVVKLNDGSLSELVEHDIPIDHTLAGYETKLVECKVCEMGT
jgi:hypothetical protein